MKTYKIVTELSGLTDIMFDRYAGDNATELSPEDRMYYGPDGKTIVLPSLNLLSFLAAQNTTSATKRFLPSKTYKNIALSILGSLSIDPPLIPITANGEPIQFAGWNDQIYVHHSVARLPKGIPNPKHRPTIRKPWGLGFTLSLFENNDVSVKLLQQLFEMGGIGIGLGTFRPVFGRFEVTEWDVKET